MNPKISIIVPIYNTEKYLRECMDSLVNQTLREIEIICIVNGCTDSSQSIIEEYAKKDNRIELIIKKDPDVGAARNTGVRTARGEYLMFVDSDDWINLESCGKLYSIAKEHDLEILQGGYRCSPELISKNFKCERSEYSKKQSGMEFWRSNNNISVVNWDKIWKRQFFLDNRLYNLEGVFSEDIFTAVKGMCFSESFMVIEYMFYYYRYSPGSITNQPVTEKHIKSSYIGIKHLKSFLTDNDLMNEPAIILFYLKMLFFHHVKYRKNVTVKTTALP